MPQAGPRGAAILTYERATAGSPDNEMIASQIEAVAENEVVTIGLRESVGIFGPRFATICCVTDSQGTVYCHALLIADRGYNPGCFSVVGIYCNSKSKMCRPVRL
ncbi:unnamed protein product [marine sediment metagenome]|uniref:Uncharacterized protein n=1 Tax=marine sediment metagenome TaxID=412755 RepID=X0VPJ6_9ZZZZ